MPLQCEVWSQAETVAVIDTWKVDDIEGQLEAIDPV